MTKKTVFVIGAGASKEANLPTGAELKHVIARELDMRFDDWGRTLESGAYEIVEALRLKTRLTNGQKGDINSYLREAWHIRDALPQAISIDNFIDAHKENKGIALCGKLGIVKSILNAENRSLLNFEKTRIDSTINFSNVSATWYSQFFQQLTENCGKNDLMERFQLVTLIIFNYDRCVEHFIFHALKNYYRISDDEATNLISQLKIYHPYGQVGSLSQNNPAELVTFGLTPTPDQLFKTASKIQT